MKSTDRPTIPPYSATAGRMILDLLARGRGRRMARADEERAARRRHPSAHEPKGAAGTANGSTRGTR